MYMNLEALGEWTKARKQIDTVDDFEEGEDTYLRIFMEDGKLFAVRFCDKDPVEAWDPVNENWKRNEYEIIPVTKIREQIVVERYVPVTLSE